MIRSRLEDNKIKLYIPMKKILPGIKEKLEEEINNYPVEVIPIQSMSLQQMKMIHALINQFSIHASGGGREYGYTKDSLKTLFAKEYEIPYFSLSPDSIDTIDIDTANKFIEFLIELGLRFGIPIVIKDKDGRKRYAAEIYPDTEKYIWFCLEQRICAVCNKPHDFENGTSVDYEHWDNVARMGGYKHDDGSGRYISLCRKHHIEKHNIGQDAFKEKYYVEGIYLTAEQKEIVKKIYKGHLQAYKGEAEE